MMNSKVDLPTVFVDKSTIKTENESILAENLTNHRYIFPAHKCTQNLFYYVNVLLLSNSILRDAWTNVLNFISILLKQYNA